MINFVVPGRIGGKGRARFVRATGHSYTPAKTRSSEAMVRSLAFDAMAGRPPLEGPVWLKMLIYRAHPKSWSKARRAREPWPTGRPDLDNALKLVADSLNTIAFRDDAQIAVANVQRVYARDGRERVEISVGQLSGVEQAA